MNAQALSELRAVSRAAARVGCRVVRASEGADGHGRGLVECADGWQAGRLLLAMAEDDAALPWATGLALELAAPARSGLDYLGRVQRFVQGAVRFERERGEVFAGGRWTLAAGYGDCDDHARIVYALLRAAGVPARLAFLCKPGDPGPRHVVAQGWAAGAWHWLETTVAARLGEEPYAAAARLGVLKQRGDIAREVRTMSKSDLPPVPPGFEARNPAAQVERDARALAGLGFLCDAAGVTDATDPGFRRAVVAFQRARGLAPDGLIGPVTRAEFARAQGGTTIGAVQTAQTAHLSDRFFADLARMAEDFRARGARAGVLDYLGVWLYESRIQPWARNPNPPGAYGLNQMIPGSLRGVGWTGTVDEYLALSAEDQLPYVRRYYEPHAARLHDAGTVYAVTFLPARVGDGAPDRVLTTRGEAFYDHNSTLDMDGDGTIRVSDLTERVERTKRDHAAYWREVEARALAAAPSDAPTTPGGLGGGLVAGLLVAGAATALAYAILSRA